MLKKRFDSFRYALKGLSFMVRTQANARIHLVASLLVTAGAWYFEFSPGEWALVILCMTLVWCAEAFNTSLESLTDLVSPDEHPLAGKAKDLAAAAVLLTAIGSLIIGILLFLPRVAELFCRN